MRRLIRLAVRLYPSAWRHRYTREFEALLDDVGPGKRQLFDVLKGAITMQVRALPAIPVLCALLGAMIGGFVGMRTPTVYASSAMIRLQGIDALTPGSLSAQKLHASLERVLGQSTEIRAATSVQPLRGSPGRRTLTLNVTYRNRDAIQAQRAVERIAGALLADGAGSAEVIQSLSVPALIQPNYLVPVASGSGIGLLTGAIAVLVWRLPRRLPRIHS